MYSQTNLSNSNGSNSSKNSRNSNFSIDQKTKEEVLAKLRQNPEDYREFRKLSKTLQEELLGFAMGVRGAKMTYDPFFKAIFNPQEMPERLEAFLGECLGEKLEILQVLPGESKRLTAKGSLLILDILVRLKSGALVNVEIQRVGYDFPGQRCACYSSDLVMRQYSRIRSEKNQKKETFSYEDIQKVYTIVLIQQSTAEFYRYPDQYLHYAKQTFDTGLELELLQEYLIIPLDIFLQNLHNKGMTKPIDGWLTFLASDSLKDIQKLIEARPEFENLYREVFAFRYEMKELIGMYSEALAILDANTVEYMVERRQKKIEEQERLLAEKDEQLAEQESRLAEQVSQLAEQEGQLAEQESQLAEQKGQLAELKQLLEAQQQELERLKETAK